MSEDLLYDEQGRLRHLLTIEGLKRQTILDILDTAQSFIAVGEREIKKVPLLRGKTVVNLFFEASTRTRTTFEIAAKRLSADVINLNQFQDYIENNARGDRLKGNPGRIERLFNRLDTNNDNELDFDEYKEIQNLRR